MALFSYLQFAMYKPLDLVFRGRIHKRYYSRAGLRGDQDQQLLKGGDAGARCLLLPHMSHQAYGTHWTAGAAEVCISLSTARRTWGLQCPCADPT